MQTALSGGFALMRLLLCLLEGDTLPKRGVELREFNLALGSLLILARPDDVRRLRRLELDEANL